MKTTYHETYKGYRLTWSESHPATRVGAVLDPQGHPVKTLLEASDDVSGAFRRMVDERERLLFELGRYFDL